MASFLAIRRPRVWRLCEEHTGRLQHTMRSPPPLLNSFVHRIYFSAFSIQVYQDTQDCKNSQVFKSSRLQKLHAYINGTGFQNHLGMRENVSSLRETYGTNCSFHLHLFLRAVLIAAYKINSIQLLLLCAINYFLCNKENMSQKYGSENVFVTNQGVSLLTQI